ncbi:MAG: acylphosphatase [Thermoproteota archaeon]
MGKAFEVEVRSRVQRTGFRRYVLKLAQELGPSGSVENRPDGSVHIFLQGEEEPIKRVVRPLLLKVLAPIVRKLLKVVGIGFRLTLPIQFIAPKTNLELVKGAFVGALRA